MKYSVYVIKDKRTKEILYIGESRNLTKRFNVHVDKNGQFNRNQHYMQVVDVYDTRKEALEREAELKFLLGFRDEIITDTQLTAKIAGKIGGKKNVESGHMKKMWELAHEARSTPILAYRRDTGEFVKEFKSQMEAGRELNCSQGNINSVLKGKRNHTGGYFFKYKK